MARYYLDPEIKITGIVDDSKVGVWLTSRGNGATVPFARELFLGKVKAGQELRIRVPGGQNLGEVLVRVRKLGWLPVEVRWPPRDEPDEDPLINIQQQLDDIEAVLHLAAIAEKYSEHPLAKAVMALAKERALEVPDPDDFRIEVGKGIVSSHAGQEIVVGRDAFLREQGIVIPTRIEQAVTDQSDLGRTAILVARNREAIGLLSIADEVRAETVGANASLKSLGVGKTTMLTGDNSKIAQAVASQIGMDEFRAELLPEDKQSAIREMKNKGKIVAMVGDGINDAPALALADVGIVMGGTGADVAIEAADVTLMDGNLSRLVEFVQMSRKVLRRIKLKLMRMAAKGIGKMARLPPTLCS